MASPVLTVFVTLLIGQAAASTVHISRCDVCDDDTPGQECFNSTTDTGTNCLGATPYCGTRISLAGLVHKVWKGCVSEQTCIDDWWLTTRLEPDCSQSSVTSGHVVSGVTCSYCCHEQSLSNLYCNHALYPESLSQFPSITASTSAAPTTIPPTTTSTTVQTTQKIPVTCPVCFADSTTGQQCDDINSLNLCDKDAPYCMTSFYRQPSAYRIEKRCASEVDCTRLWLNETKNIRECTRHHLAPGNGSDLECHFCCQNPSNGNLCNVNSHHLKPGHLMTAHHDHVTTTQTPTTTTTSGQAVSFSTQSPVKHAMNCIQCVSDTTTQDKCDENNQFRVCQNDQFYCMTSFYRTPTSYRIEKSCATRAQCEMMWWQNTFNKTACRDRDLSPGTGSDLECHFCCFSPDIGVVFCNDDHDKIVPKNLILMGHDTPQGTPGTTMLSTTPQPPTQPTTPPAQGSKCQVCFEDPSSLQYCLDTDVYPCPDDESFCLNTITYSGQQISVTKTCASQSVCEGRWQTTQGAPECQQLHPTTAPGQIDLVCSYCCNSSDASGAPCNVFDKPVDTLNFTAPPTTVTPSTTVSSTTITTPTTETTTTATTTTTMAPQTSPTTPAVNSSCAVCDDLCVFFQKEQPCSTGFCMTSVTDDAFFSRVVTKSCVTEKDCYSLWWQGSSDRNICYVIMDNNSPSGVAVQCNYCCVGNNCNSPDFPAKNTLYDGNGKNP